MISDSAQRDFALDPSKSFIVQAPAGSGKTTLLVKRYLALLAQAKNPENILAITFTRKAAAEMRARVIAALNGNSQDEAIQKLAAQVMLRDATENWNLRQNPQRLRIQTIDAFCLYLTRQTPIVARFNNSKTVADTLTAETCYRTAAQALLTHLAEPGLYKTIQTLLLHLGNDWQYLENLFINMLARREQWLPHLVTRKQDQIAVRSVMEEALKTIAQENCEKCRQLFPQALQAELASLFQYAQSNLNSEENIPDFLQHIDFKQNLFCIDLRFWQALSRLLLTAEYQWRQKITKEHGFPAPTAAPDKETKALYKEMKERMLELLTKFQAHEDFRQSLEDLLCSPPQHYSEQQWEIISALLEILPLLAAHLKLVFREKNLCDYAEIAMAARQALGTSANPTDLALTLDYQIQHLLIDEFQDTSQAQWQLLEQLVAEWDGKDGRTVFLVGDPMQSIYRFREAEVGLFLRAQHEGIGQIKLQSLTLTSNFRATENLVTWVNNNFTKIMPLLADITTGAIPFRPSVATIKADQPAVFPRLFSAATESSAAEELLAIVQNLSVKTPEATIAILVKSRSHLTAIIPLLRQAKITFHAVELESLSDSPIIQDLFALTRALLQPADRIAWLAILRAPWCGLELDALLAIANGPHATIWENIKDYRNLALNAAAAKRISCFCSIIITQLQQRDATNLRSFIESTWLLLQGPATAADQFELENAKIFFELLEQDTFALDNLQAAIDELYANSKNNSKLQIMTIHKAKGLEFDHVIIPELQRSTKADSKKLLMWLERPRLHKGSDLILAPITANLDTTDPIYDYCRHIEQKKNYFEAGRLLYVAITRAKKTLYLLGRIEIGKTTTELTKVIPKGTLLEQLAPCITTEWLHNSAVSTNNLEQQAGLHYQRLKTLPKPNLIQDQRKAITWEFAEPDAATIGTVIHKLFEIIANEGLEQWHERNLTSTKPIIKSLLLQNGIIDLERATTIVATALHQALNDQHGRWILTKHTDARSEYAVTGTLAGKLEHCVIDRTFVDNNIRYIIDYKTGMLQLEEHQHQLQKYATLMTRIDPKHPIKLGLYNPLQCEFLWIPLTN